VDKSGGLICDQSIKLCGVKSLRVYPEHIRRVRFHDPITNKTLEFWINKTSLLKQHLRIKKFLGTSETAVKTQAMRRLRIRITTPR
jgi:hypothetical protein